MEEELPSGDIPPRFKVFVQEAIDKYNRRQNLASVSIETRLLKWSNADGDDFNYSLNVGDVRLMDQFVQKQKYTLAIADVPYGFNLSGSEFDDVPFSKTDLVEMITKFAASTTSPIWRFVIIHFAANKCCFGGIGGNVQLRRGGRYLGKAQHQCAAKCQ